MRYIDGTVRGGRIVLSDTVIGASTAHDHLSLRLTLDGEWIGLELTAQFIDAHGGASFALVEREDDGTLLVPIPFAATRYAGAAHFTLRGIAVDDEVETVAVATAECELTVLPSGWDSEAEEIALPDASVAAQLRAQIAQKQDAEVGKGLSTNDFTDADKAKIHTHAAGAIDITAAQFALKQDAEDGKGLSTNDYDDSEKAKVAAAAAHGAARNNPHGVTAAQVGAVSGVVALGHSETEESIVDASGVAHLPMVNSASATKRPGMIWTWAGRYATAATDEGVLVATPKTVAQFYEKQGNADVLHENAFIAKGTLLHLMGDPTGNATIATKQEMAGKAPVTHTHTAAQVGAIPTSAKGAASGVATLNASSWLSTSQCPPHQYIKNRDVAGAHPASAISYGTGDVAAKLAELEARIEALEAGV